MAAQNHSFDIVSRVNLAELDNALNQSRKEIDNRFDFKGTGSRIEKGEGTITLFSSDGYHLKAMTDVLETHLVRRGISLDALDWGPVGDAPKGTVKQQARILQGIDQEKAREINKFVKKLDKRINVSIQKDQLRISGKSKDALQAAMKAVREEDFGIPLQFTNYR